MTTDRRFCRFNKSASTAAFSVTEIPQDGLCLSAFLIVTEAGHPANVLMGHMNRDAPWDHIGALDPKRVEERAGPRTRPPGGRAPLRRNVRRSVAMRWFRWREPGAAGKHQYDRMIACDLQGRSHAREAPPHPGGHRPRRPRGVDDRRPDP